MSAPDAVVRVVVPKSEPGKARHRCYFQSKSTTAEADISASHTKSSTIRRAGGPLANHPVREDTSPNQHPDRSQPGNLGEMAEWPNAQHC